MAYSLTLNISTSSGGWKKEAMCLKSSSVIAFYSADSMPNVGDGQAVARGLQDVEKT
ncbi:hypothetical protein [Cyanobium gracile]|uniref:hypothetical protein n=1 Tax=Cyanobium gracile TaxID=59930 RepID=UPI0012EA78D0|nr:hypothetical protein [Cyanobium gracile]